VFGKGAPAVATFTARPKDTGDEEDGAYHEADALHIYSLPGPPWAAQAPLRPRRPAPIAAAYARRPGRLQK